MKHPLITVVCLSFAILLLGAGCGSSETATPTDEQTPTTTETVVQRQPVDSEPVEEALDFCENQGHAVTFVFDQTTKANRMYCAFEENVGCDVLDYYGGRCAPSTAVTIELPIVAHVSFCPNTEEPVCGEDVRTYTNQCIANAQGVRAMHDGPCTEADRAVATTPAPSDSESGGTTNDTPPPTGPDGTANTAWLNPLVNLLSKNADARIEKCSLGGETLYYQEEHCPDCFSTLYRESGDILCFPHNDLTDDCPAGFDRDSRTSCQTIWQN